MCLERRRKVASHQQFPIKCLACSLHYIVCSDDPEWPNKALNGGFCPECGTLGAKLVHGPSPSEQPIFMVVPGEVPPAGIFPAVDRRPGYGIGAVTEESIQRWIKGDNPQRGPYGTNEGDKWLATGSEIQKRLDADGNGHILIHEMLLKDGEVQEVVYVTANEELIAEATAGHEKWLAAKAQES
jgi:hypothetical protein